MQHLDEVILEAHFNLEWATVGRALVVLALEGDIFKKKSYQRRLPKQHGPMAAALQM